MERTPTSPTARLMAGLVVTLVAVGVFAWYSLAQIAGLRELQTRVVDRNRRDSLQLLRIQNSLNSLAISMRDMLSGDEPYGLEAYKGQVEGLRPTRRSWQELRLRQWRESPPDSERGAGSSGRPASAGLAAQSSQMWLSGRCS